MVKDHFKWDVYAMKSLVALALSVGTMALSSCSDDDGLTAGDPNYFTSSRGQFTATVDDGNGNNVTLYLLPGETPATATLTYDGDNPLHWQSETTATVNVTTYKGDITLPETFTANGTTYTLTAIGEQAMMGCRSLTSLKVPSTVKALGDGAFSVCNTMKTIELPEGITEIPLGCFGTCQALTTVNIPSTVESLEKMAFYGCKALKNITIPEGVTYIGEMAFFDCPGLTEITIPASVSAIGDKAFGGRNNDNSSKISAYHVKATTPPTLEGVLYQAQSGVSPVVYVPAGCISAYKAAAGWSSLTIEEE